MIGAAAGSIVMYVRQRAIAIRYRSLAEELPRDHDHECAALALED
jgi:hypothetical protein